MYTTNNPFNNDFFTGSGRLDSCICIKQLNDKLWVKYHLMSQI